MNNSEQIYMASKVVEKNWDYETLLYGDDLYNEDFPQVDADNIWEYVEEYHRIGSISFREKYNGHKFY